ncbi:MAG: preprotein translocase subunit SecY [Candidatus Vogelbacteria bacterium]|nr:preprotein translocase subunit SecY [Candidatus Vogelbacteria bacterium]
MLTAFWTKLKLALSDAALRRRLIFVGAALFLFRLGASIPIPGVNVAALERFFADNQFFNLLNLFSGGGLSNLSIVMLGVGPYITATIIMQLLTIMFPSLKELYHESGGEGRRQFAQYARMLTVPLALLQGFGLLALLGRQGILGELTFFDKLVSVIVVTAGSILLMWLGELINEYGIGNGISLIIFAGIVAGIPSAVSQVIVNFEPASVPLYLGYLAAAAVIVAGVVVMTEAERPVPITYAKQVRGMRVYGGVSTYLPIRLNQAGVMPIIFALSLLLFPQMIVNFFANAGNATVRAVADVLLSLLNNTWFYAAVYFVLVFLFTYFYSAITFDPTAISENLQKSGAFIPGIRPGRPTAEHLAKTVTRLTLVGALFLGVVAMLPLLMQAITGLTALAIGGTALLIVVSVALEFTKQVDSQISMREY